MSVFSDDEERESGVGAHSIARSLAALSLGTVQAHEQRRLSDWEERPDEIDQQFILPVQFTTKDKPVTATVNVGFAVGFLINPVERDSEAEKPLFTYGFEHLGGERPLLSAMLESYSSNGVVITGAVVSVTAWQPQPYGQFKSHRWQGALHANFQGFAVSLRDADEQENEDDDG